MKSVYLLIIGLFAITVSAAEKPAKITGAFGLKLGETVPKNLVISEEINSIGFTEIKFKTKHPIKPFNEYIAVITPKERKIWMLLAAVDMNEEGEFNHYTEHLRKLVATKYGEMTPAEDNSSIDGQWTYFEKPSFRRSISIRFSRIDEKLLLTYMDKDLMEKAKKEQVEAKAATLDDSAF